MGANPVCVDPGVIGAKPSGTGAFFMIRPEGARDGTWIGASMVTSAGGALYLLAAGSVCCALRSAACIIAALETGTDA